MNTGKSSTLDRIDRKILHELMMDATLPVAQLADRVGLSQTCLLYTSDAADE